MSMMEKMKKLMAEPVPDESDFDEDYDWDEGEEWEEGLEDYDEEEYAEEFRKPGEKCLGENGEEVYPWVDDIVTDIMEGREGIMVNGIAGGGKSEVLRRMNAYCDHHGLKYVNLAPTNKAARNIGGKILTAAARTVGRVPILRNM